MSDKSMRSDLGRVRGMGSAKEGVHHWWMQRLTAVALVPLTLWFVIALLMLDSFEHAAVITWMAQPFNSIMLVLLLIAGLHHSQLGLQVVVEDYVHTGWLKVATLMLFKLAHFALGVAGAYSIIIISTGAP